MPQVMTDTEKTRPFQRRALMQSLASSRSTGHVCPGRYRSHAETRRSAPEPANIHSLCSLKEMRKGALFVRAATLAPNPNVTSKSGSAQQINVPMLAKSVSQLVVVARLFTRTVRGPARESR